MSQGFALLLSAVLESEIFTSTANRRDPDQRPDPPTTGELVYLTRVRTNTLWANPPHTRGHS
jgi:hypothetical protein